MAFMIGSKFMQFIRTLNRFSVHQGQARLLQCPQCIERNVFKTFATKLSDDNALDRRLRRLDQEVRRFGRVSRKEVEDIFEEIRISRSATSIQSLFLIRCCGILLNEEFPDVRTKLVEEIWNTLINYDVPIDISHYNALLRVFLENEHSFSPIDFLANLESKGIEPNTVTYQRLMERYCKDGDIEGATHILEFMRMKQLPVNESIFNALIMGHSEAGDIQSAADILNVMKHTGLEPSSKTYATLLCAYAKHGDIDNIRKVVEECKRTDIILLNKDYLDIVYSLAVNNHHQYVNEILEKLQYTVGYTQDSLNLILRLINKKQFSVAKTLFFSVFQSQDQQRPMGYFIKHMVKAECPIEEILSICEELQGMGFNGRAYLAATEAVITHGQRENTYILLQTLKEIGFPVRQHFFWPLLVSLGKANDFEGILQVLESMVKKYHMVALGETLRDYAVPWLLKQPTYPPSALVSKFMMCGVAQGDAVLSVVYNLLEKNNISDALKLLQQYNVNYNPSILRRNLVQAYKHSKDAESFAGMLQMMIGASRQMGLSNVKSEINEDFVLIDRLELLGELVIEAISGVKDQSLVLKLLNALRNQGLQLSNSVAERLIEKIGEGMMSDEICNVLDKLTSGEVGQNAQRNKLSGYTIEGRKKILERMLTYQLEDGKAQIVKKQLLNLYCKIEDLEKAEKLLKEVNEDGIVLTPGLFAQLIDLYVSNERIEKALELFSQSRKELEGFSLDRVKVIKFVNLLVKNNLIDEAVNFLAQNHQENLEESTFTYNSQCRELLNKLAERGEAENLMKVFDALVKHNFLEINNSMLGPLVKVHIIRNDLDNALRQFEACYSQYRCTPLKKYLTCKLIEAEDPVALQKLTNLSTLVHGEVNSLYDLVFAFVECGRVRQARKILETPGLLSRPERVQTACKRYSQEGDVSTLKGLVEATKSIPHIDPSDIYQYLLLTYCKKNETENALDLWMKMQDENILPTDEVLFAFGNYLKEKGLNVPFSIPSSVESQSISVGVNQSTLVQEFATAIEGKQTRIGLELLKRMNAEDKKSIPRQSLSILLDELLLLNQVTDCIEITLELKELTIIPHLTVLKRIMKKISSLGDVDNALKMERNLTERVKNTISYYDRVCEAYMVAGRSHEYLDVLENMIDDVNNSDLKYLNNTFPVQGTLNILENLPELEDKFKKICEKYLAKGSIVPCNTLWMFHVIMKQYASADELWNKHLSSSPSVKYHKICRVAKLNCDFNMAKYVLDRLQSSASLESDRHFAYVTVLDILLSRDMKAEAIKFYNETLTMYPGSKFSEQIVSRLQDAAKELEVTLKDCR